MFFFDKSLALGIWRAITQFYKYLKMSAEFVTVEYNCASFLSNQ